MSLIQKVNVWEIITGHWRTLEDDRTHSKVGDVVLFYALPFGFCMFLMWRNILLSVAAMNILTNGLAIMAGLLFNLLVVLQGLASSNRPRNERVRVFTREVYNNIAYSIVVALIDLVPLVVAANVETPLRTSFRIACYSAVYLSVHFALTLIMVLKRMYKMLQTEFAT